MEQLHVLTGRWTVEITWSEQTHAKIGGPPSVNGVASFEWVNNGHFLLQTIGGDEGPLAHWMIGRDDSSGAYAVLYADSREVTRIYEMSFAGNVWKIWRAAPGFHQRFEGRLSPVEQCISARWETSTDGKTWEHDFDITYTRA